MDEIIRVNSRNSWLTPYMTLKPFLDTPDTAGYMIFGYAIFIGLPILFIASLAYRYRNLKRDEEAVQTLEEEKQ